MTRAHARPEGPPPSSRGEKRRGYYEYYGHGSRAAAAHQAWSWSSAASWKASQPLYPETNWKSLLRARPSITMSAALRTEPWYTPCSTAQHSTAEEEKVRNGHPMRRQE